MTKRKLEKTPINTITASSEVPVVSKQIDDIQKHNKSFPIIGIGASAGGLAAFEAFFSVMPADTGSSDVYSDGPGMAFVLVQHLAPDHKSILTDLIKRYTRMPVYEVKDGMTVQKNSVYIIPPNSDLAFINGTLQLLEPTSPRGQRLPIDFFFRSLAEDQHEMAICIILSGTGSDGTLGLRAIKDEGGMAIVQTPDSTEYDGMPRSAINTGLVDYELLPEEMPEQLISYITHTFSKHKQQKVEINSNMENSLKKLFILLRTQTKHDFSLYKPNTIKRRIERRMAVAQIDSINKYILYAQQTPEEVEALFRDLLIGVTNFFRDPDVFDFLKREIIPNIFNTKTTDGIIRIWSPGCSTGEEAYSLAILIAEWLDTIKRPFTIQIFATDIDSNAIAKARAGLFPTSIASDITSERLARFFTLKPGGDLYLINKNIRDMLIFSEQDIIKDPPFSRLDLISCRNLLIYMGPELQKKIIPLFHYALNSDGYLLLGTSESIGKYDTLFKVLERKHKIFRRKENYGGTQHMVLSREIPYLPDSNTAMASTIKKKLAPAKLPLQELTEQALLQEVAPAAILVNTTGDILYLHGRTGLFLEPVPGISGISNIIKMAREGLSRDLTTALHKAKTQNKIIYCKELRVKTNGDYSIVNLTVRPVTASSFLNSKDPLYLVIIKLISNNDLKNLNKTEGAEHENQKTITALQQELQANQEYLQSTQEELETANEELKSSNEEMQSVNEVLQSTNEELETSKEELQSVNEELSTVNIELQTKVNDLSRSNNDMNNLLAGTSIGTLFVDYNLHILRFTPAITKIINLIQSDIGRPVNHILSNIKDYDNLIPDIQEVLDTLIHNEREITTKSGNCYTMHIQPYRTLDNVIEGAVITFVDISKTKILQEKLHKFHITLAEEIVATVHEPLIVLEANLKVVLVNQIFYDFFKVLPESAVGNYIYNLGNHQWDIPKLRNLLSDILSKNTVINDFRITHTFDTIGKRTMKLNARKMFSEHKESTLILLAINDITV
jgi:two-component system CheB/CheR fusion protein